MTQFFTNLLQNRLEIKPNYTEAAQFLQEWLPKLNANYELQKSQSIKGKTGVFAPASPVWLRGQDSNLQPSGYTYPNVSKGRGLYHHPVMCIHHVGASVSSLYGAPLLKGSHGITRLIL
jgi:hypothetical protein